MAIYTDNNDPKIICCDESSLRFGEVDLYNPTEDWMGLQLDYTRYSDEDDERYGRRFGVGGIDIIGITPNEVRVVIRDMDSAGEEHDLFFWSEEYNKTEYDTDGDWWEMSAEFFYVLCVAIEEHFGTPHDITAKEVIDAIR